MKINKIAAYVLGATLFLQTNTFALDKEQELPVLTLENAIQQAKTVSSDLKVHEINYELAKENAEMATLVGGYYSGLAPQLEVEYMKKTESLLEDMVTLEVMILFDEILMLQKQIDIQMKEIAIHDKQIQKNEIEFQNGLKSELDIHTLKLQKEQLQKDFLQLSQDLAEKFEVLSDTVGVKNQEYQLDKGDLTYAPYKDVKSIDYFASSIAEDHITLWKASEDLRVALETPVMQQYPGEYMPVVTARADRELKEQNVHITEQNLEQIIKQKYLDIKQLEANYTVSTSNLALQEKQILANKIYLENGLMSALSYEESILSYEKALLNIMQLQNQHALLVYEIENPYLIRVDGL